MLYFDNLSRDTADAYLADGLTEEIIIRLGQVRRLDVKSRFEVQRFRGRASVQDPTSLNAAYLVTGSLQRAGDQVRLRVALVRTATRSQVWGEVFDRTNSNLLAVESDIARSVATAVTGELLAAERARLSHPLTSDPVAYQEYLHGLLDLYGPVDEGGLRDALVHFGRAIARDSGMAAAFAGLAEAWAFLADIYVSPKEGYRRAREAALQSIARDSTQALAYAKLSEAVLALDLDARQAEELARHAVALEPRNGWAHNSLSEALFAQGRSDESIEEARTSWESDSLRLFNGYWYMWTLIYGHRLGNTGAVLARFRAVAPGPEADAIEAVLLAARGDLPRTLSVGWRVGGGFVAGTCVRALLGRGDTVAARATVDSMLAARTTSGYYNPLALARAYTALGDIDRGLEWLQRAFEERTIWLIFLRMDNELAPLRADPRFVALDRQLKY